MCLGLGNLYAATPGQSPGVARIYRYCTYVYIYICIYVYNYIVFSSAKPVTLVDVLGNILGDNELSYGTNDHRVITSDKICGSGRPDSWGLLYAQWTRDRWCGRHRKGRCAAQEGRTIFRCFGIRRSISFWVSSGVRYHCGIVCIGSGASAAGLERNFPPPEAADPGCLVKGQLMVDQLQQVRRGLRHCRICRGQ